MEANRRRLYLWRKEGGVYDMFFAQLRLWGEGDEIHAVTAGYGNEGGSYGGQFRALR